VPPGPSSGAERRRCEAPPVHMTRPPRNSGGARGCGVGCASSAPHSVSTRAHTVTRTPIHRRQTRHVRAHSDSRWGCHDARAAHRTYGARARDATRCAHPHHRLSLRTPDRDCMRYTDTHETRDTRARTHARGFVDAHSRARIPKLASSSSRAPKQAPVPA
jgi:hypothetical protein